MEIINVGKKKIIEICLNGTDCIMCLDLKAIEHFQSENKIGLAEAIEDITKNSNIFLGCRLIFSMLRQKNGRFLSKNFLDNTDEFELFGALKDPMEKLLPTSLPEAKDSSEKK